MSRKFNLNNSEKIRRGLTKTMQREIKNFYDDLLKEINTKINAYSSSNKSLTKQQLILLKRDIENSIENINKKVKQTVIGNMRIISESVVEDTHDFLLRSGFKESEALQAFMYVPDQIVKIIVTGQIYKKPWSLDGAIWGYNKQTQKIINNIISSGTAQGKSAYEIAKDLEKYVKPTASKKNRTISSWYTNSDGKKVKENFYFGRVDYNAQRLARTMVSHAYQESFERVNEKDPFVIGYQWDISNFHGRVCEICRGRAEQNDYGLGIGVFPKDQLPLDHPNGMCTFEAVIPDSMDDIARKIGEWYKSPVGTFPDIDEYANDF